MPWTVACQAAGPTPTGHEMLQAVQGHCGYRLPLTFRNAETGEQVTVAVRRANNTAAALSTLREEVGHERWLRGAMSRVAGILRSVEAQGPVGVCYEQEDDLVDAEDNVYPTVHQLFLLAGGDPNYGNGFDVVFVNKGTKVLQRVAWMRQQIEAELSRLRWDLIGSDRGSCLDDNTFARSRLPAYREEVEALFSQPDPPALTQDQRKAAWEWCASFALYTYCTSRKPDDNAMKLLDAATQLLCQYPEEETAAQSPELPFYYEPHVWRLPVEGCGTNLWRCEMFGCSDPGKQLRTPDSHPPAPLNNDSSCWINAALLVLLSLPTFQKLLQHRTGGPSKGASPAALYARDFMTQLRHFFGFLSKLSYQKYIYNTHVKDAFEMYLCAKGKEGSFGASGDSAEFIGTLAEVLQDAGADVEGLFEAETRCSRLGGEPGDGGGGEEERQFPFFVVAGEEGPLPLLLHRAMSTQGHSVRVAKSLPDILVVVVRRKMWCKKQGKPYISKAPVSIPPCMSLALLGSSADYDFLAARKELLVLDEKLAGLKEYLPKDQVHVNVSSPVPPVLLQQFGEKKYEKVTATANLLTELLDDLESERKTVLEELSLKRNTLEEELLAASEAEPGNNYSLAGIVSYTDNQRGHYWCYLQQEHQWLMYDDTPEGTMWSRKAKVTADYLPVSEEQVLQEAKTQCSCLVYTKDGRSGGAEGLPADLSRWVQANNERLAALSHLLHPDRDEVDSDSDGSSGPGIVPLGDDPWNESYQEGSGEYYDTKA